MTGNHKVVRVNYIVSDVKHREKHIIQALSFPMQKLSLSMRISYPVKLKAPHTAEQLTIKCHDRETRLVGSLNAMENNRAKWEAPP